jgi:uncharacterized protein (DUF433 family)
MSLRLRDDQHRRLEKAARRLGRAPSAVASMLLEQRLREEEFPGIVFRETTRGPEAFLEGTRWTAWRIVADLRGFRGDADLMARQFDGLAASDIRRAVAYAKSFPDEIAAAIADSEASVDNLEATLPDLQVFWPRAPAPWRA